MVGFRGDYRWGDRSDEVPEEMQGTVQPWSVLRPLLNYTYDNGFGGADCHSIYAYSVDEVAFVHEYDGSTSVVTIPLAPTAGLPEFL